MSIQKKVISGAFGVLLAIPALAGPALAAPALPDTSTGAVETFGVTQLAQSLLPTGKSGKWIEYNLSNYCLYLHQGDSVVFKTCQTSSGKEGHATPSGNFKVYSKAAGPICMHPPGDKEVCNIHYATYWRKGGYAFHEAWWMGNRVNQRISHGCVNMRKADAKTVFDFASVGTPVNVHW